MAGYSNKAEQLTAEVRAKEQIALEEWDRYQRAKDAGHEKYLERAKLCDDFYRGEQWDPQDKAALDRKGRPALTINQVLPTVNVILGEQVTRRADIRYKPAKDGTEEVASTMTKVVNQIMDSNEYDSLESEVFSDGIIQERGFFDVRIEFDDNLMGHVSINVEDPLDIIPDPKGKSYDPKTWQEVTKTRWWSLDEVEEFYGKEAADRLKYVACNETTRGQDSIKFENTFSEDENRHTEAWASSDPSNRQVRVIRVLERQFYQNRKVYLFVDPHTGDAKRVPLNWNREKRRAFAAKFKLFLHQKVERQVRWRVCADKVLLHDDWSPYSTFTIVPYFPYFRRGKTIGAVTNLLDPQRLLNKLSSQELHVVNSVANSGWITRKGSLANMTTEDLADRGAETGLVIEVKPGAESPEKIQPNTVPTGLDRIGMKAANNIREISGINEGMLGLTGAEVSGIALDSKEKRGQVQLQVPLDNLARTRRLVAKKILELVQAYYTEPRLISITRDMPREGEPAQEELGINIPTPEGYILNNLTVGQYDVVVASQPSRDTYNDGQFAEAIGLRQIGVVIPDDRMIEYSNLDKKYALAEEVRAMTGRGEVTPEQAQIQAMIQQMELQTMQLNLMKLEAEVQKLNAEAQKLYMEGQAIPEELQVKLADIESRVQIEREGFQVRAQLAMETSQSALEKIAMQQRGKQTQQMIQAALAPQSQPKLH